MIGRRTRATESRRRHRSLGCYRAVLFQMHWISHRDPATSLDIVVRYRRCPDAFPCYGSHHRRLCADLLATSKVGWKAWEFQRGPKYPYANPTRGTFGYCNLWRILRNCHRLFEKSERACQKYSPSRLDPLASATLKAICESH